MKEQKGKEKRAGMSRVFVPESQSWENGNVGVNVGDKIKEIRERTNRKCTRHSETVKNLVARCTKLRNREYLTRHNQPLMIFTVAWAKLQELLS